MLLNHFCAFTILTASLFRSLFSSLLIPNGDNNEHSTKCQHTARASDGRCQRGGNASNICSVLRQLNDNCEFLGSLSSTSATRFLIEDCQQRGINIEHCVYHDDCVTPFSSVILNMQTGSRTIVHSNPNLPILTAADFRKIPLERYKWIHFEVGEAINMECKMN